MLAIIPITNQWWTTTSMPLTGLSHVPTTAPNPNLSGVTQIFSGATSNYN